jgi:hypothetical protein
VRAKQRPEREDQRRIWPRAQPERSLRSRAEAARQVMRASWPEQTKEARAEELAGLPSVRQRTTSAADPPLARRSGPRAQAVVGAWCGTPSAQMTLLPEHLIRGSASLTVGSPCETARFVDQTREEAHLMSMQCECVHRRSSFCATRSAQGWACIERNMCCAFVKDQLACTQCTVEICIATGYCTMISMSPVLVLMSMLSSQNSQTALH